MIFDAEPLKILEKGDPLLRRPSKPVIWPDAQLSSQIGALHATLLDFRRRTGWGRAISAVQAGIAKRLVVMDLGAGAVPLIDPDITWRSDETWELWDDCLSLPDHLVRLRRHCSVSLRYTNERGVNRVWERLPQDLAELLQHEIDHLDGVLMDRHALDIGAIRPIAERQTLAESIRPAHRLSLNAIRRAAEIIPPEFLHSPQFECEPLSEAVGCSLTLKLDFTNPIRSFKGRGASYLVHEILRRGEGRPVFCASAGNWGQAMAYACRSFGIPLVVYASVNASPLKVARMQALGADVRQEGNDFDAAKVAAKTHAKRVSGWMAEDGLEPEVSEGHGTLAIELLARGAAFDAVAIPLGNGALLNGMARWFKAASPATRVLGVSAVGADAMEKSWRNKTILATDRVDTIADGIAVRVPIPEAVNDMQGLVDNVLLITDAHIIQAMRLVYQHAGLLLEPAGAVGVAAIVAHPAVFANQKVATVLCGSNITETQSRKYLQ